MLYYILLFFLGVWVGLRLRPPKPAKTGAPEPPPRPPAMDRAAYEDWCYDHFDGSPQPDYQTYLCREMQKEPRGALHNS